MRLENNDLVTIESFAKSMGVVYSMIDRKVRYKKIKPAGSNTANNPLSRSYLYKRSDLEALVEHKNKGFELIDDAPISNDEFYLHKEMNHQYALIRGCSIYG